MEEHKPVAAQKVDPHRYRSYLLRLWREAPTSPWRCQVCCVGTGREQRFAGLAELFEFLVADASAGSEGREGNSATSDAHGECRPVGRPDSTLDGDAPEVGGAGPCN